MAAHYGYAGGPQKGPGRSRQAATRTKSARKALLSRRVLIAACLAHAHITGTVTLRVTVNGKTGRVSGVDVRSRKLSPVVLRCIRKAVYSLRLPRHTATYYVLLTVSGR